MRRVVLAKIVGFGVFTVAVVGVTSAVVLAAIPSANGTITGCYRNVTGALRVIDAEGGDTCRNAETALTWQSGSQPSGASVQKNALYAAADGSDDGAVFATVAGAGEFSVAACDATTENDLNGAWRFTNTSAEPVRYRSTAYQPMVLNPGDSITESGTGFGSIPTDVTVSKLSDPAATFTALQITNDPRDIAASGCYYQSVAL